MGVPKRLCGCPHTIAPIQSPLDIMGVPIMQEGLSDGQAGFGGDAALA